jgi:dTDP-4-dehydrorhamnose reductase
MKLLLTGASGFLGWHVNRLLKDAYRIHGWYGQQPCDTAFGYAVDLSNAQAIEAAFLQINPQAVIHTAAISSIEQCEANEALAHQINVAASVQLAQLCAAAGIPFIFCSTDMVFDGKDDLYDEKSTTHSLNLYGAQKAMAEKQVLEVNAAAMVARLPLLLGLAPGKTGGVIAGLQRQWQNGAVARLFTNEYRSVAWATDVAQGFLLALQQHWTGIYHLGGPEVMNRYYLGCLIRDAFEMNGLQLQVITHEQMNIINRPARLALNSGRAMSRGYAPLHIPEALLSIKAGF